MSTFSTRIYNELYIGTRNGKSLIDSNIYRSRQRSITWATKNNRTYYFDPRKSILVSKPFNESNADTLEYESDSELDYEFEQEDICTTSVCTIS